MSDIAVVHESQQIGEADLRKIVLACSVQLTDHFGPNYSRRAPGVAYYRELAKVPAGAPVIRVVDQIDDVGALGYHSESGGRVVGMVGVTDVLAGGGSVLGASDMSVPAVLSHECLEAAFDPFCNKWTLDTVGRLWATEVSDPVQAGFYMLGDVALSNYVLPHFWDSDPPDGARFDRLGSLDLPFTIAPGGYAVIRRADGTTDELGQRPAWKRGFRSKARRSALPP